MSAPSSSSSTTTTTQPAAGPRTTPQEVRSPYVTVPSLATKAATALQATRKSTALLVQTVEPLNAEPPKALLVQDFITPTALHFIRSHAPIPTVDLATYRLVVTGLVERPLSLSLAELKTRFAATTVTATLQCAGNRRQEMRKLGDFPGEVPWDLQAISNSVWTGCRLGDVLQAAGVKAGAEHADFVGLDICQKKDIGEFAYGSSIPLAKALASEVLLAWDLNGEPLPPCHGFPIRAVVPGYIGARSVKWLSTITLQERPSQNYYQQLAYKVFPPWIADNKAADWSKGVMLGVFHVTSMILSPEDNAVLPPGPLTVQGVAFSGERPIERVDVSIDGGKTFAEASLQPSPEAASHDPAFRWAWRRFSAAVVLPEGRHEIVCRAFDAACNSQPQDLATVWNFKGYMNNGWHRVPVTVSAAGGAARPRAAL